MGLERTQEPRKTARGVTTPYKGKRTLKDPQMSYRVGFWCRSVGLALFVACPYLYHALMKWAEGYHGEKILLITGPIIIDAISFYLHQKGRKLNGN